MAASRSRPAASASSLVPGNPDGLLKSIGSLFIAADCAGIGPAYLGYGWRAAGGTSSFYFFLGRAF